jgi:hypothetical protein
MYEDYAQKEVKIYDSPGKPGEYLDKNKEANAINIDQYCSLIGKIMFFTTKLLVKPGAATRALDGYMSNPGKQYWKSMERLVGYLKGMHGKGIVYVQPEFLRIIALTDTDYGNCKETRRSVGCSIINIGRFIVDWWVDKHNTVSDISCKAEYKELAKCAKGVKFIQMLLNGLNLVQYPGLIGEDNQGAIFLAKNKQVSKRTKHIDIKFQFICSFIEENDGVQQGEVFKIHTSQNTADIGTKHLDVDAFKMHEKELDN